MQGRASTSSRSAVSLGVGLSVTSDKKGGSECSKEGAIGRRGKERVVREATVRCCGRVRAMADSWGQSQMEAIGSSSPQTSANTDVRHVTCAESSSAEEQYLQINNERGAGGDGDCGRVDSCGSVYAGKLCRRRLVM